jgi:hypothetical protein
LDRISSPRLFGAKTKNKFDIWISQRKKATSDGVRGGNDSPFKRFQARLMLHYVD